jgi:hypothetical protein
LATKVRKSVPSRFRSWRSAFALLASAVGVDERDDGLVDVRAMVFDVGDLITGWGRLVVDSDGEWLDLALTDNLMWFGDRPRPRSHYSVRLVGADPNAVPKEFGPGNVIPGRVTITGEWRDGVIEVVSQSPDGPPRPPEPDRTSPPCPPPVGGWPVGDKDEHIAPDLRNLVASGKAVRVAIFRPSPYQVVYVVAATDGEAVESVLRPQLNGRLCVVASRWTRGYLDEILAHLVANMQDWTVQTIGEGVDELAQACFSVGLMRVTPDMAEWAHGIESDVLRLEPSLLPVGFRAATSRAQRVGGQPGRNDRSEPWSLQ